MPGVIHSRHDATQVAIHAASASGGNGTGIGVDFSEENLDGGFRWTTDDGSQGDVRKRKGSGGRRGRHGGDLEELEEEELEHEMLGAMAAVEPCFFFSFYLALLIVVMNDELGKL